MNKPRPLAVYVHWPYCARICPYCDFNVVRDRGQAEQARLAKAIVRDLEGQAAILGERRLSSIFLGGGTPSLMRPDWAAAVIEAARRLWPADGAVEATLEANPTDAEAGRFRAFREAGVDRLSLGVQSLDEASLRFLGRNHGPDEARRALDLGLEVFPRVSVDLIYALPGQRREAWAAALREVVAIGPEHVSPYQLTVESGTALDRSVRRGAVRPVDEPLAADLYETTQDVLGAAGFEAYEVSNHARGPGARSAHNLAYWRGFDYVGAGPGAHGRLSIGGVRRATRAQARVPDYIAAVEARGVGFGADEPLSAPEAAIERLLLGLRSMEGVPLADIEALRIDRETIAHLADLGLLAAGGGRLVATAAGRAVLDRITSELIG